MLNFLRQKYTIKQVLWVNVHGSFAFPTHTAVNMGNLMIKNGNFTEVPFSLWGFT